MLEKTIKAAVRKRLTELGAYQFWPVPMGIGNVSIDCIGCHKGKFFGIECKRPGGKATPRQIVTMREISKAGGIALLIDSMEEAENIKF